jgi:hypothetical protein
MNDPRPYASKYSAVEQAARRAQKTFPVRIADAPTFDAASDLYMEARAVLPRSSAEWGRCVLALWHRPDNGESYKHGPE